jgi:hypothetical protein
MTSQPVRIFGLVEWERWLDQLAKGILGLSGAEFEKAYMSRALTRSGSAQDLGAVLMLIQKLRKQGSDKQSAG